MTVQVPNSRLRRDGKEKKDPSLLVTRREKDNAANFKRKSAWTKESVRHENGRLVGLRAAQRNVEAVLEATAFKEVARLQRRTIKFPEGSDGESRIPTTMLISQTLTSRDWEVVDKVSPRTSPPNAHFDKSLSTLYGILLG